VFGKLNFPATNAVNKIINMPITQNSAKWPPVIFTSTISFPENRLRDKSSNLKMKRVHI